MTEKNKYRWIPVLMGISQILLTGFVVYWIIGQYNSEKENLSKEMHFEFVQAQSQAMDSTIHIMIEPFLNDSLGSRDSIEQISVFSTSARLDSVKVNSFISPDVAANDQVLMFDITDSLHPPKHKSTNYEITAFPHREVLLRGVKMIIKMSEDSAGIEGREFSSLEVDSAIFLDIASKRLNNSDHADFDILWYEDSLGNDSVKDKRRILFHSGFSHPSMVYEIANYKPFLIKMIIPQILFGLLLLLLTGFAFLFTYRSLKRQLLLNTLRNEFISNVSHELKTPVSTVKVALEALQNYDQRSDRGVSEEYLRMASLEMDRLDLLIQKILNQSLLESTMMVNRESKDIIKLITAAVDSYNPRLEEKDGKIVFNSDIKEAFIYFDDLYIHGVLINLLDNALKYGGTPPLITVTLREDPEKVYVDVIDNGPGISSEHHKKIFERFYRIPSGDRHNVKGYGLGLSFAAEVMKQHEGSIIVDNNPGGGCIFTLCFTKSDES